MSLAARITNLVSAEVTISIGSVYPSNPCRPSASASTSWSHWTRKASTNTAGSWSEQPAAACPAKHQGFALIDSLRPCVSFNKVNTYEWSRRRVVPLEPGYDPTDRLATFARAHKPALERSEGTIKSPPACSIATNAPRSRNKSRSVGKDLWRFSSLIAPKQRRCWQTSSSRAGSRPKG